MVKNHKFPVAIIQMFHSNWLVVDEQKQQFPYLQLHVINLPLPHWHEN